MKYSRPASAEAISQAILSRAWVLTVGVKDPTWKFDIKSRSSTMLTMNWTILIRTGISGWSMARVHDETAVDIADESAETEDICTYASEDARTPTGTNAAAKLLDAAIMITVMSKPRAVWAKIKEFEMAIRECTDLLDLSPMISHAARGRPSLMTCAMTPM